MSTTINSMFPIRISVLYIILTLSWSIFRNHGNMVHWFDLIFFGATSVLLYILTRLYIQAVQKLKAQLQQNELRIEELQNLERQLSSSEKRLESLIVHNSAAIFTIDQDGIILQMNKPSEDLLKVHGEELIKTPFLTLVDDGQRQWVEGYLDNALKGQHLSLETQLRYKDTAVNIGLKTVPIIVDHVSVGAYIVCRDITEQRQITQELWNTKEQLESIFQHSPDGILLINKNFEILHYNNRLLNILRTDIDNLAKRIASYKLPENTDPVGNLIHRAFHSVSFINQELKQFTADGHKIILSVNVSPIRDETGEINSVSIIAQNITKKKHAEESLRRSEAKYRLIVNNISDLILVLDEHLRINYASPSSHAIVEYDPSQIEYSNYKELVHPEDYIRARELVEQEIFEQSSNQIHTEVRVRHKRGHWVHLEVTFIPVYDEKNRLDNIVLIAHDVTERKQAEEILRKSEKLSVVGQLAAGVAHEIRNPLTSLRGFVQLLETKTQGYQQYFDIMLSELDRIHFIVNEFLFLAKPQASLFQKRDLSTTLHDMVELINTQAIMNNIIIDLQIAPDLPMIECEENQLKQVFVNLLKNAIEAMPDGGKISIEMGLAANSMLMIRVTDEGVGIPPDRIPKLGEPFYTTKEKGTGLGLMVSYKIIENHRGSISIESTLGKGTTVEIQLPVNE